MKDSLSEIRDEIQIGHNHRKTDVRRPIMRSRGFAHAVQVFRARRSAVTGGAPALRRKFIQSLADGLWKEPAAPEDSTHKVIRAPREVKERSKRERLYRNGAEQEGN